MARVTQNYNLEVINPNLAKKWHPAKNGTLTPNVVTPMSGKKVWWICKKGHESEAHISNRSNGIGCPYCSGKRPSKGRNLQVANPDLAKEWHPTKNVGLFPRHVTPKSGKNIWWTCDKGHVWEATISHRSQGSGCPYCSGNRVCDDNCLQTINPQLSQQWHPTKNGVLTPRDVTAGSRKKVWWVCNDGHEWKASVATRNRGTGCPYCTGQVRQRGHILNNKYPLLYLKVKGLKSRLLTDLIRLFGTNPSGIGYTIERAEVIAKDNNYQLIDLLCVDLFICIP